jgi:hypothetical protein
MASRTLSAHMIGLPADVRIAAIYADTPSQSIKVVLQSDVRFDPVPEGAMPPSIYPKIELRLMPAKPVLDDEPQRQPDPDDVMFVRYVMDEGVLPPVDEGECNGCS